MGVCLLGSLNLVKFLNEDWSDFDWDKLREKIKVQIRMMDNVVDLSHTALPIQKQNLLEKRKLGMGILGYASALYMLRKRYGSKETLELTEKLMEFIANEAYIASSDLAAEKGSFPLFEDDKFLESEFVKSVIRPEVRELIRKQGMRNSHLLAIAPTGNTSIYAGIVSGGLEPVFDKEYIRTAIVHEAPPGFIQPAWWEGNYFETEYFKWSKEGDDEILIAEFEGEIYKIDKNRGLTKESVVRDYGWRKLLESGIEYDENDVPVARNLTAADHINTMAIFAKYIDQAISKTINIPNGYIFEVFKDIYLEAWTKGIKGFTTYREGTMASVLSTKDEKKGHEEVIIREDVSLPDNYKADGIIFRSYEPQSSGEFKKKKWYVHIARHPDSDRPFAIFVHTNHPEPTTITLNAVEVLEGVARSKGIPEKWIESNSKKMSRQSNAVKVSRIFSLLLRHGVSIKSIVEALDTIQFPINSLTFQIKKYLMSFIEEGTEAFGKCPECGSRKLIFSQGCKECGDCRYSFCS